jgi:formyl-CoA transferase
MGCFESADGFVNVAGPSGRLLTAFCEAIGLPDLPADPRFDSSARRAQHRDELNEIVSARLRTRTTADWVAILNGAGVPCGPVYRLDEVFADPQVEHLGLAAQVHHRELGDIALVRNAVTMDTDDITVRSPTPDPGEHTVEVLTELGFDDSEVAHLRATGAIPTEAT